MTDGLVEALDPDGEPFGYDRVRDCFAGSAAGPAQTVIDALLAAAEAHLAGHTHQDDMTFVVLRATG
jgi:serine phosphatase RsbU (regulator of sigma subunit)